MENLHFVISTGQNVANLIPLLEIAQTPEPIVILSSDSMRKGGQSDRLKKLLEQKGYYRTHILPVSDEVLLNYKHLKIFVQEYFKDKEGITINFYLNGGQKLPVLAIREALAKFSVRMVYLDGRKTQLVVVENQDSTSRAIQHHIQLTDVLQLYGSEIKPHKEQQIYANGNFQFQSQFPPEIQAFYHDKTVALEILQLVQQLNTKTQQNPDNICEDSQYLQWLKQQTISYRNDRIKQLLELLEDIYNVNINRKAEHAEDYLRAIQKRLTNQVERLVEWAMAQPRKKLKKYLRYIREPITISPQTQKTLENVGIQLRNPVRGFPMGIFFETVVTYRLIDFLKHHSKILESISEIWTNVEFQSLDNPGKTTGEYDILILMKNGIIIALECKSFDFEEKDLFSRIARLLRRGGILSEFWVVLPLFTEKEFNGFLHKPTEVYLQLQDLGIRVVPFTLEGQPAVLKIPESETPIPVEPFEEKLAQLLSHFVVS